MIKSIILKYIVEPLHIEIVQQTGKVYTPCLYINYLGELNLINQFTKK